MTALARALLRVIVHGVTQDNGSLRNKCRQDLSCQCADGAPNGKADSGTPMSAARSSVPPDLPRIWKCTPVAVALLHIFFNPDRLNQTLGD
ncbi:MAG: hypothetical protein LBT01_06195 [Spirochaetaceae bacterium]|nr:hypothetical protein [Spirochaetaceae bacterium]